MCKECKYFHGFYVLIIRLLFFYSNLGEIFSVFKYNVPSENNTHPHNVYLLPNMRSFLSCNISKGVKIANESQGAGEGFEFVLNKWKPYYFVCGATDGYHCNVGGMKFFVLPLLRRWHY